MPRPERPSPLYEHVSFWWFRTFAPRLPSFEQPDPPAALAPWETVRIGRSGRRGTLVGTWYPTDGKNQGGGRGTARGAVLLLPPWVRWGRSYFHRRGRLHALRSAGYHALTVDFPGRGGSGPAHGFFDRDVEDALRYLEERATGLPLHLWGVSAGGYWSHLALARHERIRGAMFEDVSPHLVEWGGRMTPAARPLHAIFRTLFRRADRYLDLRGHAARLRVDRVSYVSGELDPGVRPEDTRELAALAGGRVRIIDDADHLEAIKVAGGEVIELALRTFREAARGDGHPPRAPESPRSGKQDPEP